MKNQLNAGDFESKFSELLADAIAKGYEINIVLIAECYRQAATNLGLPPTGADDLHIVDIHSSLSAPGVLPPAKNARVLKNKIYDLIYMH
ncbi:hypothetical protein [Parvibium lacunae]|uniref:Uncharacterized protein n=1 Tax=Parvibium lacunae TaxID=1888893 RepID=A0A368KXZ8_9BURK|nr:hypothetical protein [Parvibium lacunae]RCS56423.1 hypothetical protein DU000_12545 [Parvibium lacunae]